MDEAATAAKSSKRQSVDVGKRTTNPVVAAGLQVRIILDRDPRRLVGQAPARLGRYRSDDLDAAASMASAENRFRSGWLTPEAVMLAIFTAHGRLRG